MYKIVKTVGCVLAALFLSSCAYRYYLGAHGPSIKNFPDIHQGFTIDADCMECHDPDQDADDAPPTSHPGFKGCLKCHND